MQENIERVRPMDLTEHDDKVSSFFRKGAPLVNFFLFFSFLRKMDPYKHNAASWCSFIFLASVALSSLLNFIGVSTSRRMEHLERRCKIAYVSTVLRMIAAATLLLFFDTIHVVVTGPLFLLVLMLLAFFYLKTFSGENSSDAEDLERAFRNNMNRPAIRNWRAFKIERTLLFNLSAQLVSMSFGGLSGTILGYVKGTSNQTGGYKAPECFIFCCALLGLQVVLLSSVPPAILHPETRSNLAKVYMRILAYAALMFLVLASIIAAQEIIFQYVFVACFAVVAIAVLCFLWEHKHNPSSYWKDIREGNEADDDGEADNNTSQYLVGSYFTSTFGALMAAHSKYGIHTSGTVSLSFWFKSFVLWAVCSILTYATRMVVVAEMRDMKDWAFPKKAWTLATYATMALTVVSALLVGLHHRDEITNIF